MAHATGNSCSQMAILLPFLLSAAVVLTSAIRSETGADDKTFSVGSRKTTDAGAEKSACCTGDNMDNSIQVRLKRSPPLTPGVGVIAPKQKQGHGSMGKESLPDVKQLRWQGTGDEKNGESVIGDLQADRDGGKLEEMSEETGNGLSNGRWGVKNEPSREYGVKTSAEAVEDATDFDRKRVGPRKLGEDNRGINRFLSMGWSKPRSLQSTRDTSTHTRTRRDLRALKRMLDDVGAAPSDQLPEEEEEEGPPEMSEEEQEMYEDNVEVPQVGASLSGDATRRQDFSKRPKYYPDWGPKRTWRINMMRVWGKRNLAGYDRNLAHWNY